MTIFLGAGHGASAFLGAGHGASAFLRAGHGASAFLGAGRSAFDRCAGALLVGTFLAACAAESSGAKSTTPAGSAGSASEIPASVGAARADFEKTAREVDMATSDCQAACKALSSLERAANHLCLVAEPEECSDARARLDRARRAVTAQCGGC